MQAELVVVWLTAMSLSLPAVSESEPLFELSPPKDPTVDEQLTNEEALQGPQLDSPLEDLENSVLEISALSRPLHLGTLYNARNDQLIPGIRLWKTEDIENKRHVHPHPFSNLQVAASESLSEKTSLLDVSTSLKLGIYGGLVEVEGSANYLKQKTTSTRQCSVTLKYHVTTVHEELIISDLEAPKTEDLHMTDATHVVLGVMYGASALMEFRETASNHSDKQDIKGNLHVMIKKIPEIEISGDGSLVMDDDDKDKVKNFNCKFYGDFQLQDLPSTYEDAVRVYKELPKLLGEKGEKAVPVKVWLHPLSKFSDTASKMKSVISQVLVSQVEKVMDDFHQAEIRSNDLLERSREIKATDIIDKLEQFQSSLRVFTSIFLQRMAELIPAIRGGNMTENSLRELLKSQDASGFIGKDTKRWLDKKEIEINIVTMYIKDILDYKIKSPGSEFDSFLMDPDIVDAFVFSFTSLSYEEPYLKKISHAAGDLKSGLISSTPQQDATEEVPWYKTPEAKEALDSALKVFNVAIKNKVVSFISDPKNPGASVRWYHNSALKDPHVTDILRLYACNFTLDPDMTDAPLVLSEGNRKVTRPQDRFFSEILRRMSKEHNFLMRLQGWSQALSREALPTRCYWECEWDGEKVDIAVAYKSIVRHQKGIRFGNSKSWCLRYYRDGFSVLHNNNEEIAISVTASGSRRAGVYLDREAGTVSFYSVSSDTDTYTHLYTFHTTFTDEPLHAGLLLYGGLTVTLL